MANSLGALVVTLGLNAAEFVTGLTKAEYQTKQATQRIAKQLESIKSAAVGIGAALGAGLSVSGIVAWGESVTQAAESINDLATVTGSSVEELSRLSNIAKYSGTSFENFESSIERLAAGLNGSEELSTKTASALQYLGISTKDPARALQEIADKLNLYADGSAKAALARDLFGRSGVRFLDTLKEIAQATDITSTRTAEQAEQAENLAKSFRKLSIESNALKDAFLNDVAPALEKIVGLFTLAAKTSGGFFAGLGQIAGINPFGNVSQQITEATQELEKFKASAANPVKNFLGGDDKQTSEQQVKALTKRLEILRAIQATQANDAATNYDARDLKLRQKPLLQYVSPGGGAAGAVDDPSRKILEGAIRAIEADIAREKDILSARQDYLRDYYSDGYISLQNYYGDVQKARDDNLTKTLAYYDKAIAAEQAYQASTSKATDKQDAQNKIDDFRAKQSNLIRDAITQEQVLSRERERSAEQYAAQLGELNAKMLDLAGNTAAAASIRFDAQNAVFNRSLKASGNTEAIAQQASIKASILNQIGLNEKLNEFQNILQSVGVAQERINLLQQTGAISEIQALTATSAAAKQQIDNLTRLADEYQRLAEKSSGIVRAEALQRVDELRLSIEKLGAQTDLLGDKFQNIFKTAFVDNLTDAIAGTKSWADAFKDAEKQIVAGISRIAAQNIGDAIFGKEGPAGGLGGLFSSIFGTAGKAVAGTGGAAGVASSDAALATLSTTAATTTAAFSAATVATGTSEAALAALGVTAAVTDAAFATAAAAATTLAAAMASASISSGTSSAASGISSIVGAFIPSGGGLAGGTDYARGGPTIVGERGPEIVNLPKGSQVTSNSDLRNMMRGRPALSIVVNVPPGTSGPSADQIALKVGAATQRAIARNG